MEQHGRGGPIRHGLLQAGLSAASTTIMLPGGDVGAVLAAAAAPLWAAVLTADRQRSSSQAARVLGEAVRMSDMGPEEAEGWVEGDDARLMLTRDVVQAAMTTLDERWVAGLSRVLADGMADDAKIDVSRLVARALLDLEPAHISLVQGMLTLDPETGAPAKRPAGTTVRLGSIEWPFHRLLLAFPHLSGGLEALLAGLERHGLIMVKVPGQLWFPGGFAVTCLHYLREQAGEVAVQH